MTAEWLEPLSRAAFTAFGVPVTWTELLGDVTGAICVYLVARQNIWNWPVGIANNAFFFALFLLSRLYADAGLQIVYAALGAYGWRSWLVGGPRTNALPVKRTSLREWAFCAGFFALAAPLLSWLLSRHTDSPVPVADATMTVLSLIATWGQAKKRLESWWIWIAVDVISVPLYVSRSLYPTAVLYFAFGCLCVLGLREWTGALKRQDAAEPALR